MMMKSLRRNLLRTSLTYLAVFVLVLVVTAVWSMLDYVDGMMNEKASNIKVIVSEKWQASSHMPFAYAARLSVGAADPTRPQDVQPLDSMTWQIYVGSLDANKKTRDSFVVMIGLEPIKLLTIMDELLAEIVPAQRQYGVESQQRTQLEAGVRAMERNKRGMIIGKKRLDAIRKKVGDRITLTGMNFKDVNLEFDIVGELPESGRYDETAFMHRDYLNDALDAYERTKKTKHPMADRSLDIVWLKVADQEQYSRIAGQIEGSGYFNNPPVKCETLSSAVATVMESYRELVWGLRWLLSPAILIVMALVISNAISLSVRERRTELAVLKVLGFAPLQVLTLVLGEALLIGAISGLLSTGLTFFTVNILLRTVNPVPAAIPTAALWWGPVLGGATALMGSLLPAGNACRVRVSEVFARVT
ncbi:MAG: ABC transporter permease [Planctomycetia bacterium]|nr:ABC transporter permease [Planctomycetia bacterium]